ncbi:hypothetical protein [Pseudomonas sp. IT-P218]|jgi:hypothetical protein|uniref:hypothetical protein n=1 Tax=Pseudomonas sp. IT-P218 TaxID=3026449 RepID=UPI0039DFB90F
MTSSLNDVADKLVESVNNKKSSYLKIASLYVFVLLVGVFYFTARANQEIFVLSSDTLSVVTQFYNALVLLLIPFFWGALGGSARLLLSGMEVLENWRSMLSSGMMGAFSWLSIKSKVFLSLVAPYIAHEQLVGGVSDKVALAGNEFYSLTLVAVIVGMFSSNIYIAINERVELATRSRVANSSREGSSSS